MDQHPIPQHIAAFEFKLFGNLTVRQFVTLSIPMSLAVIIFFSNLPAYVRFPLAGLVGLLALVAALLPFNGRPLDKWVVIFIKAILAPTQRVWTKEPEIPEFLSIVTAPMLPHRKPEPLTSQKREELQSYLRSLPRASASPLDVREQLALERLGLVLGGERDGVQALGRTVPAIIWASRTPEISGKVPLYAESSLPQIEISQIAPHAKHYALPGLENKLGKQPVVQFATEPLVTKAGEEGFVEVVTVLDKGTRLATEVRTPRHLASEINFSQEVVIPIKTADKQLKFVPGVGQTRVRKLHFAPPAGFDLSKLPVRGEKRLELSEELKRRFHLSTPAPVKSPVVPLGEASVVREVGQSRGKARTISKQVSAMPKPAVAMASAKGVSFKSVKSETGDTMIKVSGQKTPGARAGGLLGLSQMIPLTDKPNVLSGQITMKDGTPVEGAIFIVRDANGIPLRALRTNKLGQFLSATPLANGRYTIEVEDEHAKFDSFAINLGGAIVAPFEIKAKG